jgi:hypothetical protein
MRVGYLLAAAGLTLLGQPAFAHHCFDDVFDRNMPLQISGRITSIEWVNPHVRIHIAGANAAGPVKDWVFWAATPNALLRTGVTKQTLVEGAEITIEGFEAKDKSCPVDAKAHKAECIADARRIVHPSGLKTAIYSGGDGGPPAFGKCDWSPLPKATPN